MMSLSSWNSVFLEVSTPWGVYLASLLGFFAVGLVEWGLIRRVRRPPELGRHEQEA